MIKLLKIKKYLEDNKILYMYFYDEMGVPVLDVTGVAFIQVVGRKIKCKMRGERFSLYYTTQKQVIERIKRQINKPKDGVGALAAAIVGAFEDAGTGIVGIGAGISAAAPVINNKQIEDSINKRLMEDIGLGNNRFLQGGAM